MKILEDDVVEELDELKELAKRLHREAFPDDAEGHGWVQMYRPWVEEMLQKEVLCGQEHAARYKATPTILHLKRLHSTRRTAAILHEDIYLVSQGIGIPKIAAEYGETVAGGCR